MHFTTDRKHTVCAHTSHAQHSIWKPRATPLITRLLWAARCSIENRRLTQHFQPFATPTARICRPRKLAGPLYTRASFGGRATG
jgi:hypothetical protein